MRRYYFTDDAERFAHHAWRSLKLTPPADLEKVARKLGLDLYFKEFVPEIDGIYLRMPGAPPIIVINNCYIKPSGRRRFTLAHEIGHHLLCTRTPKNTRLFFLDGVSTSRSTMERACDKFASLLLMPEDITRKWFQELDGNPQYRVSIMSERFQVSPSAMRIRLKELDLPYQRYHYRSR